MKKRRVGFDYAVHVYLELRMNNMDSKLFKKKESVFVDGSSAKSLPFKFLNS